MAGTRKQDDLQPAVEELQGQETPQPPTAPDGPGPGDEASGAGDQDAEAPVSPDPSGQDREFDL